MSLSPQPDLASARRSSAPGVDARLKPAANDAGGGQVSSASRHRRLIVESKTALFARRQAIVLQLLADFSSEARLDRALMATANTIKNQLQCTRVSFGLRRGRVMEVAAISQQATIEERTSETELLRAALLESSKRDELLNLSASPSADTGLQAHRLLAAGRQERQVVTVPLCHERRCVAVLCLERDSAIDIAPLTLQLISHIASVLAPLIAVRLAAERSLVRHARESMMRVFGAGVAPRYMKLKLIALLTIAMLLTAAVVEVPFRVKASAELVPLERRVISAPRDGYIQSVDSGAGDLVRIGDALMQLDTDELLVEQSRWQSELASTATELRSAMAAGDRRKMAMLKADADKHRAQLALLESELSRSAVRAPVSGVIVSGDLSQMVGAPVKRGETLMELAPPDGYAVHLMVDEKDISNVSMGDQGRLSLKALPGDAIDFTITAIHPVGLPENGMNRFRVEAALVQPEAVLLPGQTGIGKIDVGSASLLWTWTHEFGDWFRHKRWEWFG
ncbi:efflux RND transporter periplasmic adaptor subunit [Granulosicoccus sp. 3-233]|uniref:efflux RND transporter periplasmic adaptor subunit n=1 Tax=Granulosicoccus sp. 3-233 TaxID=3417969 RepID=UPI003D34CC67